MEPHKDTAIETGGTAVTHACLVLEPSGKTTGGTMGSGTEHGAVPPTAPLEERTIVTVTGDTTTTSTATTGTLNEMVMEETATTTMTSTRMQTTPPSARRPRSSCTTRA